MENIITLVVAMMIVIQVIQLIYHAMFKVAYVPRKFKLISLANVISVIVTAGILGYFLDVLTDSDVVYVIPTLCVLAILNTIILYWNWKKHTLSAFVQNGIYDFEVQGLNRGFVFGRIYWDRINHPDAYCTGWLYADYEGRPFRERRAEYIKNSNFNIGDLLRVSFVENVCYPYCSFEENKGNIVEEIS